MTVTKRIDYTDVTKELRVLRRPQNQAKINFKIFYETNRPLKKVFFLV